MKTTNEMQSLFNKVATVLGNLCSRWQDEYGYEDIAEYRAVLQKHLTEADATIKIVRMTKRPFGCEFNWGGERFVMKCTASGRATLQAI